MTRVEIIETSGLGDRSYLATDGQVAIVVDPQRDIDRILQLLELPGARLAYVLETHIHNDYVTGGLELARAPARSTSCRPTTRCRSTAHRSGRATC